MFKQSWFICHDAWFIQRLKVTSTSKEKTCKQAPNATNCKKRTRSKQELLAHPFTKPSCLDDMESLKSCLHSLYFFEQETLPSLFSTGSFQERILANFSQTGEKSYNKLIITI